MAKNFKWDSKSVIAAVGRVRAEAMKWTAQDIQKAAKRSMKKKKNFRDNAPPGSPPNAHEGGLKSSVRFAWDPGGRSVVIGPVKYKGRSAGARALEHGGRIRIKVRKPINSAVVSGRRIRGNGRPHRPLKERSEKEQAAIKDYYDNRKRRVYRIAVMTVDMPARPAMTPAMKKELKKMGDRLKRAAKKFKR